MTETEEQRHARWVREHYIDEVAITLGLAHQTSQHGICYWNFHAGEAFRKGYEAGKNAPRGPQDLVQVRSMGLKKAAEMPDPAVPVLQIYGETDYVPADTLADGARLLALEVHASQKRKYTDAPYVTHLAEVAGIVATVAPPDLFQTMVATAWLHDCVEDQGVEQDHLVRLFGRQVASGVMWLSDLETGNRAERKAASRTRLSRAPWWVQTIKCADLISNTSSIRQYDPKFAVTYLEEKRALLAVLNQADSRLLMDAVRLAGNPEVNPGTDGYGTATAS